MSTIRKSAAKTKMDLLMDKMSESEVFAFMLVVEEFVESKKKHPNFADGSLTLGASIVSEECGEMCKEINGFVEEDGTTISNIMIEAAHTAVTSIRMIEMVDRLSTQVNLDEHDKKPYKEALQIIDGMLRDGKDEFDILTKLKLLFTVVRIRK
jgi:hypothetical protein